MSPEFKRRPFVFSLQQNFSPQLAAGQLVYKIDPVDLIDRLTPIFFIGIGRRKLITGPYELTTNKVAYNPIEKPQNVARMNATDPVFGVWEEIKSVCPYHVSFRPLVPIKYGVPWDATLCEALAVDMDVWRGLIQVELSEHLINKLAEKLTKLNTVEST